MIVICDRSVKNWFTPGLFIPVFFHQANVGADAQEAEMITGVYLPIRNPDY